MANEDNLRRGKRPGKTERPATPAPNPNNPLGLPIPEGHRGGFVAGPVPGSGWTEEQRQKSIESRALQASLTPKASDGRDFEKAVEEAMQDPYSAMLRVQMSLAVGVERLTARWLRAKGTPPRELMEAIRELRQTTGEVNQYLKERGAAASSRDFLAQVQARLGHLTPHLAGLSIGPVEGDA